VADPGPLERKILEDFARASRAVESWRDTIVAGKTPDEGLPLDDFAQGVMNALQVLAESIVMLASELDQLKRQQPQPD
jgi:hypothetical protein